MAKSAGIVAAALASFSFFGGRASAQDDFTVNLSELQSSFAAQARQQKSLAASATAELATAVPETSTYTVRGVDVSHHDGEIDWKAVRKSGITFAYLKATEGDDFPNNTADPDQRQPKEWFQKNWRDSAKAGVVRGAYHFYNFCKNGADQAANFKKLVPTAERGTLPPVLDLEESQDCPESQMPKRDAFRKDLAVWVAAIKKAYRQTPVMYVNYSIYDAYFKDASDPYPIWITDGTHRFPQLSDRKPWALWQYGYRGAVPGIPDPVDLDVFNGTAQALAAMTKKTSPAPARRRPGRALIASTP